VSCEEEDGRRKWEKDYPSDWEEVIDSYTGTVRWAYTTEIPNSVSLGAVPTTNSNSPESAEDDCMLGNKTGRMLSFPNWIQVSEGMPVMWRLY
jgi:hypothetical protein